MSVRPLVAYDDITLPYESPNPPPAPHKKRKRNNNNNNNNNRKKNKHRDDPRSVMEQELEDEEDEESRELTHEEIWDDSALVNAWDSAMEEYEAYHGPDKSWKNQPIHKSPLWYNTPSMNPPKHTTDNMEVDQYQEHEQDENSKPLNFDTFIPTHDPTLAPPTTTSSAAITTTTHSQIPTLENPSDLSTISQDEAFNRALQASYWSGYWTAIYHSHRQQPPQPTQPQSQSQSQSEPEQQQLNVQPQPQTLTQNSTTTTHPTTDQDQKDNNNDIQSQSQSQSQTELDNIDSSSSDNDDDNNDDEEGEEFVSTQR